MRPMRRLAAIYRCKSGAAAIEFAVIGLVLIMTITGIIEIGRGLYQRNALSYASDVAARMILLDRQVADADLESTFRASLIFGTSPTLSFDVATEVVDNVQYRTIRARYPFTPMVPGIADNVIILSVSRQIPLL